MTLTEQLTRLAEIAPDVCSYDPIYHRYFISDYTFWITENDLTAAPALDPKQNIDGRPALAWLRDALEQVIEARGWQLQIDYTSKNWRARIIGTGLGLFSFAPTSAEALLAALIAALEGEG